MGSHMFVGVHTCTCLFPSQTLNPKDSINALARREETNVISTTPVENWHINLDFQRNRIDPSFNIIYPNVQPLYDPYETVEHLLLYCEIINRAKKETHSIPLYLTRMPNTIHFEILTLLQLSVDWLMVTHTTNYLCFSKTFGNKKASFQ